VKPYVVIFCVGNVPKEQNANTCIYFIIQITNLVFNLTQVIKLFFFYLQSEIKTRRNSLENAPKSSYNNDNNVRKYSANTKSSGWNSDDDFIPENISSKENLKTNENIKRIKHKLEVKNQKHSNRCHESYSHDRSRKSPSRSKYTKKKCY